MVDVILTGCMSQGFYHGKELSKELFIFLMLVLGFIVQSFGLLVHINLHLSG